MRRPSLIALVLVVLTACSSDPGEEPAAIPVTAEPAPTAAPAEPVARPDPAPSEEPPVPLEGRNRLGDETSPYLLQHRHNPVHWWPWGPEAIAEARRLDRPIFLSVGYSTCYWCHVMERESFESDEVAAVMNERFVCVKVDREERPDIDDIYMNAVQVITGQGGWPMSVFIEPEKLEPFFGGTYFPAADFVDLMMRVDEAWVTQRPRLLADADRIANSVVANLSADPRRWPLTTQVVERGTAALLSQYDQQDAGFVGSPQRAPKFPVPVNLDYLMMAAWELRPMREAVTHTLDRMALGGMYDQVGGGFHRYSTDASWLVPHFEKMLYDNGQLATTYARAYEDTGDAYYAEIIRETLDYAQRELTGLHGAFLSAQDAEVNHREGQNYIWTPETFDAALRGRVADDDLAFARDAYGIDARNELHRPAPP